MKDLIAKINECVVCKSFLPHAPRPVVQLSSLSKILIISQAPGKRVHESGIPWNDASGDTLRQWLNVDKETFYDAEKFAFMPMSFCYPGKGKSGDLAPRNECAPVWHSEILKEILKPEVTLLIGQYAHKHYLNSREGLTSDVKGFRRFLPQFFPLPHPSPRNFNWMRINPWFSDEVLPYLQQITEAILKQK